jgi:deazaflavin-dependent oxidoreductase (nitroreductase family)
LEYRSSEQQSHQAKSDHPGWWFMNHLVNPLVRFSLRSPFHRLISGSIMLITYRGRKSGHTYTLPVQYVRTGNTLNIVPGAAETKTWWRNLRGGAPVRVRLRGQDLSAQAEVLTGEANGDEIRDVLDSYLRRFPAAAQMHQVRRTAAGSFESADLQAAARQTIVVRVTPDPLAVG